MNKLNTIIYLDYDDTCFFTSWATKNHINIKDPNAINKYPIFSKLDDVLYKLFKNLSKYGTIVIITNAMPVWVEMTMQVMPLTEKIMKILDIKVVSARKNYQLKSTDMAYWKEQAFIDELESHNNIISCGDAVYEYYALINLHKHLKYPKYLKSIRFLGQPTPEVIMDQINVLNKSFDVIHNTRGNLDLVFKI